MRKRKNKKNQVLKPFIYKSIAFVIFIISIYFIVHHTEKYLHLKKEISRNPESATANVFNKVASQGLFTGMNYHVLIKPDFSGKTTTHLNIGDSGTVTKKEFDRLKIGDSIKGYSIEGKFYTKQDVERKVNTFTFFIVIMLFSLYPIGYLIYLLDHLKKFRSLFNRILGPTIVGIIAISTVGGLLYSIYSMGPMLTNWYQKIADKNQIETTALITDTDEDINYSKHHDSHYYLAFFYINEDKKVIHITKEVTPHTYYKYQYGGLPITYNPNDPYRVFIKNIEFQDVVNFILTNAFFSKIISVIILTIFILIFIHLLKSKKEDRRLKAFHGNR